MPDPVAATPSRRGAIARFLRDAVLRGRPRNASGTLGYDALQATPTFGWNDAGYLNMGLWHEDTASSLEACETLLGSGSSPLRRVHQADAFLMAHRM